MADLSVGYDAAGTPKTYTTVASAFAAASSDGSDNLQIYYSNTAKSRFWYEKLSTATTKQVGVEGMLPSAQVTFLDTAAGVWYQLYGDLSGVSSVSVIKNLTFVHTLGSGILRVDGSGGDPGAGLEIRRCRFYLGAPSVYLFNITGGSYKVVNNLVYGSASNGIDVRSAGIEVSFNTALGCNHGINIGDAAVECYNNLCVHNKTADFLHSVASIGNNNASSDATAANGNWSSGSNNQTSVTDADISPMLDNANGFYPFDWRVFTDSGLIGDGVAVSGETLDIDGQTRANPPAIGCSEGITFSEGGGGFVQSGSGRFGVREV